MSIYCNDCGVYGGHAKGCMTVKNIERIKNLENALDVLWKWTNAEIEHFEGSVPDEFIVEMVENALNSAVFLKR